MIKNKVNIEQFDQLTCFSAPDKLLFFCNQNDAKRSCETGSISTSWFQELKEIILFESCLDCEQKNLMPKLISRVFKVYKTNVT